MMRPDTSLHADQAWRHVRKSCFHLATRPLLMQHDRAAVIKAYNVERVLADIDANHGDGGVDCLRHGLLLVFGAPCQPLIAGGAGARRTIPLADLRSPIPRSAN